MLMNWCFTKLVPPDRSCWWRFYSGRLISVRMRKLIVCIRPGIAAMVVLDELWWLFSENSVVVHEWESNL